MTTTASASSAQVSAHVTSCSYDDGTDDCYVNLSNPGTSDVSVTTCSIQVSGTIVTGAAYTGSVTGFGPVALPAGGTQLIVCTVAGAAQSSGSQAWGFFSLSNGALVAFTGTWQ
jgi:hypothetical protein